MPAHKNSCRGRPYGGMIIMILKSYESGIKLTNTSDSMLPYVIMETNIGNVIILNIYLPCNTNENRFVISEYLGK